MHHAPTRQYQQLPPRTLAVKLPGPLAFPGCCTAWQLLLRPRGGRILVRHVGGKAAALARRLHGYGGSLCPCYNMHWSLTVQGAVSSELNHIRAPL